MSTAPPYWQYIGTTTLRLLLTPLLLMKILEVFLIDTWQSGLKDALWNLTLNTRDTSIWVLTGKWEEL